LARRTTPEDLEMADLPPLRTWSKAEMTPRIARYADLSGARDGLPDSALPECQRELVNVIGFAPPTNEDEKITSPLGANAARNAAIEISEGFNMGFVRCKAGCGPLMHNHDTNETFMPISGRWRCSWNEGAEIEHVDLGPLDVVSFPPGVARRFENVTHDEPDKEHVLLVVIAGDAPAADFTPKAWERINQWRSETGQNG
jgi:quercetin dioxygenase-like cupin family protein